MRTFLFILSTIFFQLGTVDAQSKGEANGVSGSVIGHTDSSPLPHAYLFLKNYPGFSVLAGPSGEFTLHFPEVLKNDTLVVTLLGYQQVRIPLSRLNSTGNRISLKGALIGLDEVVVKPEGNSLEEMIAKAIENIPKNYPDKRHQLTG